MWCCSSFASKTSNLHPIWVGMILTHCIGASSSSKEMSQKFPSLSTVFCGFASPGISRHNCANPSCRFPYRDHQQIMRASVPTPRYHISGQNAYTHCFSCHTRRSAALLSATASHPFYGFDETVALCLVARMFVH